MSPRLPADVGAPVPIGRQAKARQRRALGRSMARWLALVFVALGSLATLWLRRAPGDPLPDRPPEGNIVYLDVQGWYGRSAAEVAARTPYDLTISGLPGGLPLRVGHWQGEDRPHDPAVDRWLDQPDVALQRTYRRADGHIVWLSLFGSRGKKSYRLFEHTPESCYPLGGWHLDRSGVWKLPRGPRPLPVNYGLARNSDRQLVFVHLYVWDSPARDPSRGVISLRLAAPVISSPGAAVAAVTQDFLGVLFPSTLPWRRF